MLQVMFYGPRNPHGLPNTMYCHPRTALYFCRCKNYILSFIFLIFFNILKYVFKDEFIAELDFLNSIF
jgi:hypothetical protein